MGDGKTTCSDCRLFATDPCVSALGACLVSWVPAPGSPYDGYECVSADSQSCGFFEKSDEDTAGDTCERIESDAARHTCDFISDQNCNAMTCEQCEVRIRLDLIRRCRSLAKKEAGDERDDANARKARKKAMISQPMNGRTDSEVACDRSRASGVLERLGYEVSETLYEDFVTCGSGDNVALLYLARSLGAMARCDAVYFCRGWSEARGCCVEHLAAKLYGLETIYEDWAESAMAFSVIEPADDHVPFSEGEECDVRHDG